jgi:RND family efflux transporter MFP subunit
MLIMNNAMSGIAALSRADELHTDAAATTVPPPERRWRTRVLLPGGVFGATAIVLGIALQDLLLPVTPVRTAPVLVKSDVDSAAEGSVVVQAPGWVEADPFATAVSALADGVVEEVLVLEGQRVEANQVVARLVEDDARIALQQADATLRERQAELTSAQAALAEAQRNWDHPIELTRRLQTSEAQLAERRAELERWPAELLREEAHAVYMLAEFERIKPLHANGQASDIELIQARQNHEAQQAQLEATRRRKPILEAQIASLEAEVRAARDDLELRIRDTRLLDEARARVAQAEARVAAAQAVREDAALRLDRMSVRSPVSGVVMVRLVEPGSKAMLSSDNPRSAQIVRLYDPAHLQVRVDVPLVDAAKVGVGQKAEVIVDVLPDRVYRGHVTRVVHEADVQKNTLQVKVAIENPTEEIKPEMLARARFLAIASKSAGGQSDNQCILAPRRLVTRSDGEAWVWLADQAAGIAHRRAVEVGSRAVDDWVEITSGLTAGDRLIADAPASLSEGNRIRIIGEWTD